MNSYVVWILEIVVVVFAWRLMIKEKSRIPKGQVLNESLTTHEKYTISLLSFVSPILSQAIFYYGWKKQLPLKATGANKIGWIALVLLIVTNLLLWYFFNFWLW
jgi:hypothetical protein